MVESNLDRFLGEAEECVRQTEIAIDPIDKRAWLQLAEEWIDLARTANERDM